MLVANWLFGPFFSPFFGRKIMLLNRPPEPHAAWEAEDLDFTQGNKEQEEGRPINSKFVYLQNFGSTGFDSEFGHRM